MENIPQFKVGQNVVGPWFSGVVVCFETYETDVVETVKAQPTEHTYYRMGVKLNISINHIIPAGSLAYFFIHQFPEIKIEEVA